MHFFRFSPKNIFGLFLQSRSSGGVIRGGQIGGGEMHVFSDFHQKTFSYYLCKVGQLVGQGGGGFRWGGGQN